MNGEVVSEVISHEEMLDSFRRALEREGVTWAQLRDSMSECGCCSSLGERAAELWWLVGLKNHPELSE